MELTGRERAQSRVLGKEPIRTWGGNDALAKITSVIGVSEPSVCPDCRVVSRLVHISARDAMTAIEVNLIPAHAPGDALREAKCILCTAAEIPSVRLQQAHAGHIWFLIGDASETPPSQAALNQHLWTVIAQSTPRQRAAARRMILEVAASKGFGCLHLPHSIIAQEEKTWLMGEIRQALGEDALGLLGEDALQAFIDQLGVPFLLRSRSPRPEWAGRVRFVPTPEGIEAFRELYVVPGVEERVTTHHEHRRK